MKKIFLRILAALGVLAVVMVVWIGTEVTLLTFADEDHENGDYAAALEKWRFLADYGITDQAETEIGKLYLHGQGVDQDEEEATRWFARAADNYDLEGIYYLGMQYNLGRGAPNDYEQAAHYLGLAAEYDHAGAQYFLANMYMYGQGVPEDKREGEALLTRAVANGDYMIRYGLRGFYLLGLWKTDPEVEIHDLVEAYKWLLLAVVDGDQEADDRLTELDEWLTEEERAEANDRAVAWLREHIEVD
ncbi:MAG: sel1 repeat family protein [Alphaproteobacteria bacterium]|nr:sel1 repeat family protein [Alphaproteobacteria bacterium]